MVFVLVPEELIFQELIYLFKLAFQLLSELHKLTLYKTPCRKYQHIPYCFLTLKTVYKGVLMLTLKQTHTEVTGWNAYCRTKQNIQRNTVWFFSFLHQLLFLKSVRNRSCPKMNPLLRVLHKQELMTRCRNLYLRLA